MAVTTAAFFGLAQVTLRDARVHADRGELPPGLAHRILDCDDLDICPDEDWLIFDGKHPRALQRLEERGCRVRNVLQEEAAIGCPKGLSVAGARTDRIFHAEGLASSEQIGAGVAWEKGIEGAGVRVAILDTGIVATHPELSSRIVQTASFTGGDGTDLQGHGTHVAGIVASQGLEDSASKGVAPGANLLTAQVCDERGLCLESNVIAGLEWALGRGAKVINLSLGGDSFGDHCDTDPLAAAVNDVVARGAVVVASAGNTGGGVGSPACASSAIAVGAVDGNDARASFSSVGTALDLMAPGVSIYSTYISSPYQRLSGTSMASPHVAGAVALVLAKDPSLDPAGVSLLLTSTAKDLGNPGFDNDTGYGRVDVASAFEKLHRTIDADADGFTATEDCDDSNAAINPAAAEVCNGADDNCDSQIDEGFDADADGIASCGGDCNDNDAAIHPGATELCNGTDDDCDSLTDEDFDTDADGVTTCAGDCNDSIASIFPNAPEACNGRDDNCNDRVDEDCQFDVLCGNGTCEDHESALSCPEDCGITEEAEETRGGEASPRGRGAWDGRGEASGGEDGEDGGDEEDEEDEDDEEDDDGEGGDESKDRNHSQGRGLHKGWERAREVVPSFLRRFFGGEDEGDD